MADFIRAVNFVLGNEGGFSNDPEDAGGATNYGISLRFLQALSDERLRHYGFHIPPDLIAVEKMTLAQATAVYEGEFWKAAPFAEIPRQPVCNYVFDMAVNHGPSIAIKLVQRSVCAAMTSRDYLVDDGILGAKTIAALTRSSICLPMAMIATRAQFYRELVIVRPANRKFLDGWLARAFRYG